MEEIEVNRTIDAAEVDVAFLQEIEVLLLKWLGESGVPVKALMSGVSADQSFDSMAEFKKLEIPDGVTSISLKTQDVNVSHKVVLSFSEDRENSRLQLNFVGIDAKEGVRGIVQELEGILVSRKTMTRFIHSWFGYPLFILFGVLPAGFLARDIVGAFSRLDAFYSLFACTLYTLISVFLIRQFVPYCVFDSPFNRKAKTILGLVGYGIFAILILGALAASWKLLVQN